MMTLYEYQMQALKTAVYPKKYSVSYPALGLAEEAGEVAGSKLVRTSLTLRLINGKTNKVLKTFRGTRKEGRRSIKASASLAAHKICKKNVTKIVKAIDKYFKR